eukprot:7377944-Prymnesium_polylepis.1
MAVQASARPEPCAPSQVHPAPPPSSAMAVQALDATRALRPQPGPPSSSSLLCPLAGLLSDGRPPLVH